ncbi:transmembrane regulatory protein toxS [Vibrio ishigakensis]|uniref:Transmembrane regulatory protein toxS n=1 Tax=Vibrio ishigakensis TaxID=1481914 RepID=A0A0B8QD54_9VIBR|nr:transmembrane regulatory protein toxS [Vibrio ishigakensis]GAM69017.1 transmembrane regulatory protein toxS [Vibrio sp. JCM 19236]GAM73133.1 transmembrane regulatory protein toxS [Vibrio ishigakensis]
MNQKTATVILVLSAIFSGWLYWGSDVKIEQILTSREWQTNMNTFIVSDQADDAIGPLSKVHITSNVKYLPNGDYLRESRMQLFNENKEVSLTMSISETGRWELSDNYLLIDLKSLKTLQPPTLKTLPIPSYA